MKNLHIPQVTPIDRAKLGEKLRPQNGSNVEFEKLLRSGTKGVETTSGATEVASLKFSKHALQRVRDRGIALGDQMMEKLNTAVEKAEQKGARETLILSDDSAFVVSVPNRTVITALDKQALNGNLFTNIDSTILI